MRIAVIALLFVLAACSDGSDNPGLAAVEAQGDCPSLEMIQSPAPVEVSGGSVSYSSDVRYGDRERNLFDIYLPDSDEPTPLVLYFHGGAYYLGDKSDLSGDDVVNFLEQGVAFATINYSFINLDPPYDDEGVLRPLLDSARALQFIRCHAESFNIDPQQVASYGVSAGASTSLWLGTHDDLADPDSDDPVLRQSTRVKAVAALHTQSTLNFTRWEEVLAPVVEPLADKLGGTSILVVAATLGAESLLLAASGVDSVAEVESDEKIPFLENIDAIGLMDAGDAPIYAYNNMTVFEDASFLNQFLHHTLHVLALYDRAQEVGLENVMYAIDPNPAFALADPSEEGHVSFLTRHIR